MKRTQSIKAAIRITNTSLRVGFVTAGLVLGGVLLYAACVDPIGRIVLISVLLLGVVWGLLCDAWGWIVEWANR